jgi:hypothetical protein
MLLRGQGDDGTDRDFCVMRITFEEIKKKSGSLVSMTSLRENEFIDLANSFGEEYDKYIKIYTIEGKKRERPIVNVRKNGTFPTWEDKLLFILMYLKTYPLQAVVAGQYGMSQPQVQRWIKLLKQILISALDKRGCLPAREVSKLQYLLAEEKEVYQDATEREIMRPVDYEVQKEFYSGKKTPFDKKSYRGQQKEKGIISKPNPRRESA